MLLVAQAVSPTLHDPDLVVEGLDEAECDLVLGLAVGRDPVPVSVEHRREAFEGLEPLPLERGAPVLEEPPRPALARVAPQLPERLLEQVGRVQPLVRGQEELQAALALKGQVLAMGQERVLLPPG